MDFLAGAAITLCGHAFCERCIFEWTLFNKDCPVCRQRVRQETPCACSMVDSLVESYLQQPAMERERENFGRRKLQLAEWKAARTYTHSMRVE